MFVAAVIATSMVAGQAGGVPADAKSHMETHVGDWIGEWKYGDDAGRNELSVKWSSEHYCTIANLLVKGTLGGEEIDVHATILLGWRPDTNELVETNYSSNGVSVTNKWTVVSPNLREGTSRWVEADGSVSEGKCRLEFEGSDAFILTDYDRAGGGREFPKLVLKYRRVKK